MRHAVQKTHGINPCTVEVGENYGSYPELIRLRKECCSIRWRRGSRFLKFARFSHSQGYFFCGDAYEFFFDPIEWFMLPPTHCRAPLRSLTFEPGAWHPGGNVANYGVSNEMRRCREVGSWDLRRGNASTTQPGAVHFAKISMADSERPTNSSSSDLTL